MDVPEDREPLHRAPKRVARRRRPGVPDPVDIHVGQRVRIRRALLGLSQEMLGAAVGLTFQQIQKYERGANRMGASRLYDLAQVLEVPVAYFFEEMPHDLRASRSATPLGACADAPMAEAKNPLTRRETLELARNYHAIGDARARRALYALIKAMASAKDR